MAEAGKLGDVVDTLTPRFLHRSHHNNETLKRVVRDMATDTGPEAFVRQQKAIRSRPDSRPLLASSRCPSLVLFGDGDELTPPELSKEICTGISGARLVVVPECGHLSTIEKPDAVNAALADPELQKKAQTFGMDVRGSTPDEMGARMARDIEKWARVIEKAGIPKE